MSTTFTRGENPLRADKLNTALSERVSRGGDTMQGRLILAGDPVAAFDAATKQYVDRFTSTAYIGAAPPGNVLGPLWWDNVNRQLFIQYNDGSSTQWVSANSIDASTLEGSFLPLTGGTVSPGPLNVVSPTGYQQNGSTILNVFGSGNGSGANTIVGYLAGASLPAGDTESTFVGYRAGWRTSGVQLENTYIGWEAGKFGTTATFNTAVGVNTLGHNVTSSNAVAIGTDALRNSLVVSNSIAIGAAALRDNNQEFSIAIGTQALQGQFLAGEPPGNPLTSGNSNVAIGFQSMQGPAATVFANNIAIGNNTAIGIISANNNVMVGASAGNKITTGPQNILIGTLAGSSITTAFANIYIGHLAGKSATNNNNIMIGDQTGQGVTAAANIIAIGAAALGNGTNVNNNLAIGTQAMQNVNAPFNVAIGFQALSGKATNGSTGASNIAIGYQSMLGLSMTTAQNNVVMGANTFENVTTGSQNVFIGNNAGFTANTDLQSVVIGSGAGQSMHGTFDNTLIGSQAGQGITTGNGNTVIGSMGGTAANQITTGAQNIVIGDQCQVPSPTASGQIVIGNMIYGQNCTGVGTTVSTGQIGIGILPNISLSLNLGLSLGVSSVKVVGARDTGWNAMTGTADKATAFATSTVTMAQLAGRVMALQAALTTHGLIGA